MKSTIKFRAKNLKGEWVYGFYVEDERQTLNGFEKKHFIVNDDGHHYVNPETVGQFMGLRDKNDLEMYHGDIVQLDNGRIDVVSWGTVAFQTALSLSDELDGIMSDYITLFKSIKVIGNIHDNPELLKGGNQ